MGRVIQARLVRARPDGKAAAPSWITKAKRMMPRGVLLAFGTFAAVTAFPSRNATPPLSSFPTQCLSRTDHMAVESDFPPAKRRSDLG
jgi:hypothetical protein